MAALLADQRGPLKLWDQVEGALAQRGPAESGADGTAPRPTPGAKTQKPRTSRRHAVRRAGSRVG